MHHAGKGKELKRYNDVIIKTAETISSLVGKLLFHRQKIRGSETWTEIGKYDALKMNFDDGVNNVKLIGIQ